MRPMYELLDQPLGLTDDVHFWLAVVVYGIGCGALGLVHLGRDAPDPNLY